LPAVDQALVIGEGESFLSAILVLNPEEWTKLAKRFGLDADSDDGLEEQKLHTYLLKGIKGTLKDFPGYAKIRRVILTRDQWTVDNGLLTPTLKVKRAKVLDKFSDRIAALYANGPVGKN
jgi:long-chain acyl-CoA synthetase